MRAIVIYAVQRALLFLAPFVLLMVAQVPWAISLLIALLFAFAASYVFLRRYRAAAVEAIAQRRPPADEDVEDAAAEDAEPEVAEPDADATPAPVADPDADRIPDSEPDADRFPDAEPTDETPRTDRA